MIKKLIVLALLIPMLGFQDSQPPFVWRKVQNTSFQKNEVLKYRIHYGIINAGTMSLTVVDKGDVVRGRPCYYARCEGKTNSAISWAEYSMQSANPEPSACNSRNTRPESSSRANATTMWPVG